MSASGTFNYESNKAYEELVGGDNGVFSSNYQFLVFCASVGHARGEPADEAPQEDDMAADGRESKEIRWEFISQNSELSVVTASLTYAHTGRPESLLDIDAQTDVLVKYGAAGSRIIYDEVVDQSGDNLNNLIDFIEEQRNDDRIAQQSGVLEQIQSEFSSI